MRFPVVKSPETRICILLNSSSSFTMSPTKVGRGHYKITAGVCLSVRLSVTCLDFNSRTEKPRKPELAKWKHITRVTRESI